jgi:hypothetical protein
LPYNVNGLILSVPTNNGVRLANCKDAIVFGLRYAGWYLQLSNVQATQVYNAQADTLLEQKLTGSQFH